MKLKNLDPIQFTNDIFNPVFDMSRQMLERVWFRNILYYMGEQWIEWLTNSGVFQKRYKYQPFIPTPVSNIIRDNVRAMKALYLNKDFRVSVWPNSKEQKDRDSAALAELYLKHADIANDEAFMDEKDTAVFWMVLMGTSFMRTSAEATKGQWAFDKEGKYIGDAEEVTRSILPFNVVVDFLGSTLRDKRFIGIQSLQPREWVEDTFKVLIGSEAADTLTNYQKRLMTIVGSVSPWKSSGIMTGTSNIIDQDLVLLKEVEFKPTADKPNGRYIITAGNTLLKDYDRLPIPVDKNSGWDYTITDFHMFEVPGRFWSDSVVNDLISPQNTINQIDQALEMNRKSFGRPTVVSTVDTHLKRLNLYGQSYVHMQYDPILSQGVVPRIFNGKPLPAQILDERSVHASVAQEAAGDPKNILRGAAPSASASGVLVDILREAAELSHTPDINRYYRRLKKVYRKRLLLAQNLITSTKWLKIAGKGEDVIIKAFKGSEIRDNTDVRLELASGAASTNAGRTQTILRLAEIGMFGDLEADPDMKFDLLRRLGLGGLKDKISSDVRRAEMENSLIADGQIDKIFLADFPMEQDPEGVPFINTEGEPEVLVDDPQFKFDNHLIHFETHRRFIVGKEFAQLDDKTQTVLINHTDLHELEIQNAMRQAAPVEESLPEGEPLPPAPAGEEEELSPEAAAADAAGALAQQGGF